MPQRRVPDVTVIMTVYNGAQLFGRALESLARQTIGQDRLQVLVVDDGSTDESPAVLEKWAAEHPSFEIVHQPNSGGPAAPRNRALQEVRGRYMFFLDQDDYVSDDAMEAMVRIADANGTDVVVPRIKGTGGRNTPIVISMRTLPRTDAFGSSAYWVLNPAKLFRTEMVRSLGLRFGEDLPVGEDVPFVARALFEGHGVSVLADKDYVLWVWREDGSNITTSRLKTVDRLPGAEYAFELFARLVPPGPNRDLVMQRCFRADLLGSVFLAYRVDRDPAARAAAFARIRVLADTYYNERIESGLPPQARVLMRLVTEDRPEEFAEYLDAFAQAGPPRVVLEGESTYLALPWFRDATHGLPDTLFEIGERLRAQCRVEPVALGEDGVHVAAACQLGALTDRVTCVRLVARSRDGGADVAVPLAHHVLFDEMNPRVAVDDTAAVGEFLAKLPPGAYDLFLNVAAGDTGRERRVVECAPPPSKPRTLRYVSAGGRRRYAILSTTPKGGLTVTVAGRTGLALRGLGRLRRAIWRAVRR